MSSSKLRARRLEEYKAERQREGRTPDLIPNGALREAFLQSDLGPAKVARRLGWIDKRGVPDTSRLNRILGLKPYYGGRVTRKREPTQRIQYSSAVAIARAIGVDPWELDL